jgi:hypothetical protein
MYHSQQNPANKPVAGFSLEWKKKKKKTRNDANCYPTWEPLAQVSGNSHKSPRRIHTTKSDSMQCPKCPAFLLKKECVEWFFFFSLV